MIMTADAASMPPFPSHAEPPRWTAAELLSSYRYWSLVLASVFAALAVAIFSGASTFWLREAMGSFREIGTVTAWMAPARFLGMVFGCGLGIAVGAAGRGTRAALVIPAVLSCATVAALLTSPHQAYSTLFAAWGLFSTMLTTTLVVAAATMLVGARLSAPDFAVTFGLLILIPATSAASFVPLMYGFGLADRFLFLLILFLALALLSLLPMRRLRFDVKPRRSHRTHALRWRTPWTVTVLALVGPLIALVLYALIVAVAKSGAVPGFENAASELALDRGPLVGITLALGPLMVAALFAAAYIGTWCYRIHSELASVESTDSLLTPLAAVLIALFVPLGLTVILIMLWTVLDQRARRLANAPVSRWTIVWSVFIPAVGMGMIQSAVNRTTPAA